jgi:hypothetical protein
MIELPAALGETIAALTHGERVLQGGRQALEDALAAEPWYHRPS